MTFLELSELLNKRSKEQAHATRQRTRTNNRKRKKTSGLQELQS
tara:strand:+ start:373 stop:504 length:132 start_codon:yes stop_codon:yes gene_type:complete